jgi:flagellar biosynthesis chaperone FliJ
MTRLATVARLFDLQLEQARVDRVTADEHAEHQREIAKQIQSRIDDVHGLAHRGMQSAGGVTADELRRSGTYAKWQMHALTGQQRRVRDAADAAERALAEVTRRYQALSAIEQLSERRTREAAVEAARTQQKSLDDQALLRAGAHPWP